MKDIEAFLQQSAEDGAFPGATWTIGNKNGILEEGAVGTLGQGLGPTGMDTMYDMASITKIIVTYALMRQFQDGLVRMDDVVGDFLPAYRNHPLRPVDITLFELLTHTSVIPGLLKLFRHAHTREDMLEAICWQLPRADSPDRVAYTSKGYMVLGEIIAAVDGMPLDEAVRRRVLEPLGMADTCFNPPAELLGRIAPTEDDPWRGCVVRGQVHDENAVVMGGVAGHAGIFSTAGDITRAAAVMLDGIAANGTAFFHPATIRLMTRNYTEGKGQHRGLGFMISGPEDPAGDLMSAASFGHIGFTGTSMWIDPETSLYCVLLSNRIHPRRDNEKLDRVRHIFHNKAVLQYT